MVRLKISSKGHIYTTTVTDMDTGNVLPCLSIAWEMDASKGASLCTATLKVVISAVEIEHEGTVVLQAINAV